MGRSGSMNLISADSLASPLVRLSTPFLRKIKNQISIHYKIIFRYDQIIYRIVHMRTGDYACIVHSGSLNVKYRVLLRISSLHPSPGGFVRMWKKENLFHRHSPPEETRCDCTERRHVAARGRWRRSHRMRQNHRRAKGCNYRSFDCAMYALLLQKKEKSKKQKEVNNNNWEMHKTPLNRGVQ